MSFIANWWFGSTPVVSKLGRKYGCHTNWSLTEEEKLLFPFKTMKYHGSVNNVKEVDLRPDFPVVPYDQGNIGSCTAQAWTAAFEFEVKELHKEYIEMSRLGFYYQERELMGTTDQDSGAQIKDGAKIIKDGGIGIAKIWPYDTSKCYEKPPSEYYDDLKYHKVMKVERVNKSMKDITQCFLDHNVIVCGIAVYESFEDPVAMQTGVIPYPDTKKEKLLGGHAIVLCGLKMINNKQYVICRNSWGTQVQDNGYFYLSEEFIMGNAGMFGMQELCSDLWTIKVVDEEKDPNVELSDDQKLNEVKNLLGVESPTNELEILFDGLKNLVVKVESMKH